MNYFLQEDIDKILDESWSSIKKLSQKTILITGASGFLGRYFVESIRYYNSKSVNPIYAICIDNNITSSILNNYEDDNIKWIYGDVSLVNIADIKVDYIIHAAGIASPEHYRAYPLETIDVAVNSTKHLLEKAKKDNAKMLFFSSSEIYGDPTPENIPTKESYRGNVSSMGPRACYDESKRLGETLCWIYNKYYNVHVNIVRPFNIYGPGMMPKDYRILPNFAKSIFKNESLKVYGSGNQTRSFCYISDAIVCFFKILIDSGTSDVYNVGNQNQEISMIDLANLVKINIEESINIEIIQYPEKYPDDEPNRRCPDNTKLYDMFGYKPETSLHDGLKKFFYWTKENYKDEHL